MLAVHPVPRTPRMAAHRPRAQLRVYSSPGGVYPVEHPVQTPVPRTGEVQPIGQLLPQVLARYLSPTERK